MKAGVPRVVVVVWLALGVLFFGSLALAADLSPRAYDFRRTVISSLASPRDNPHAYGVACAGLALSGLLLWPLAGWIREALASFAPRRAAWAVGLLRLGAVALTLAALLVPGHYRVLGLGRMHEHLAQICAVALCLALVLAFTAMLRLPRGFAGLRVLAGVVVLVPATALIVSRLALWLSHDFLPRPVYEGIKASLWSSLALWEWIGAASLYLFLGFVVLCVPEDR